MVLGLTPAFPRNRLSFFFLDEAGCWHQIKRAQTPILRAFLKPFLEESLKNLTGNQTSVDLLEHWRYLEPLLEWELADRWWLLYLLTERGADLPLYDAPQDLQPSMEPPFTALSYDSAPITGTLTSRIGTLMPSHLQSIGG